MPKTAIFPAAPRPRLPFRLPPKYDSSSSNSPSRSRVSSAGGPPPPLPLPVAAEVRLVQLHLAEQEPLLFGGDPLHRPAAIGEGPMGRRIRAADGAGGVMGGAGQAERLEQLPADSPPLVAPLAAAGRAAALPQV